MHLRDGGQTGGCLKMTREAETPAGAQGRPALISQRRRENIKSSLRQKKAGRPARCHEFNIQLHCVPRPPKI